MLIPGGNRVSIDVNILEPSFIALAALVPTATGANRVKSVAWLTCT